jgi:periplasmic divalent cation tolerance protein
MAKAVIILSTYPNEESVACIARKVINTRLCACVNFTAIRSIYIWKGKLEDQREFIALFKSTKKSSKKLKTAIAKMHPYDVPEIIELEMSDISKSYLLWLTAESMNGKTKKRHYTSKR